MGKYYWWKSHIGKPPLGSPYWINDTYATVEEPDPSEIDRCKLVLFCYGTREYMLDKLENGKVVYD